MLYGVVLHLFTPLQDGTPQSLAPRVASPTGLPCRVTLLLHGDELLSFYVLKNLSPLFPNSSFCEYNSLVAINGIIPLSCDVQGPFQPVHF